MVHVVKTCALRNLRKKLFELLTYNTIQQFVQSIEAISRQVGIGIDVVKDSRYIFKWKF